jgi:hypothetical protein
MFRLPRVLNGGDCRLAYPHCGGDRSLPDVLSAPNRTFRLLRRARACRVPARRTDVRQTQWAARSCASSAHHARAADTFVEQRAHLARRNRKQARPVARVPRRPHDRHNGIARTSDRIARRSADLEQMRALHLSPQQTRLWCRPCFAYLRGARSLNMSAILIARRHKDHPRHRGPQFLL